MSNNNYPARGNTLSQINLPNNMVDENSAVNQDYDIDAITEDQVNVALFPDQDTFESSFISRPYFVFDMAEPVSAHVEFTYNFYTKNERTSPAINNIGAVAQQGGLDNTIGQYQSNLNFNITSDEMISNAAMINPGLEQLPMYNKILIKGPQAVTYHSFIPNPNVPGENLLSYVQTEGAYSSLFFTGFEMYDSYNDVSIGDALESGIYSSLGGLTTTSYNPTVTGITNYEAIINRFGGIYGAGKDHFLRLLRNNTGTNYSIHKLDISPEKLNDAKLLSNYSSVTFSCKYSDLFFGDIFKGTKRFQVGSLKNENISIESKASAITDNLYNMFSNLNLGEDISTVEFELPIRPYEDLGPANANFSPTIKHVGYIIKKTETNSLGSVKRYPDRLIITDSASLYLFDPLIKYGCYYNYTIRSVYEVISEIYFHDTNNQPELGIKRYLLASEGINQSIHCNETVPPLPPAGLRGGIDFKHRVPKINWQFPVNKQRDIVKFGIFKRETLSDPFTLVAEYDFSNLEDEIIYAESAPASLIEKMISPKLHYTDYNYLPGSRPIYTLCSIDAHGMSSGYSTQISIKYNKHLNIPEVQFVSRAGAPKPYPNLYIEKDTFLDCIQVSNYDKMHIFFDPDHYMLKEYVDLIAEETAHGQKGQSGKNNSSQSAPTPPTEQALDFLRIINKNGGKYKIHLINIDLAKSEEIDIHIKEEHTEQLEAALRAAPLTPNTIKFKFW